MRGVAEGRSLARYWRYSRRQRPPLLVDSHSGISSYPLDNQFLILFPEINRTHQPALSSTTHNVLIDQQLIRLRCGAWNYESSSINITIKKRSKIYAARQAFHLLEKRMY
jgi:hypothetical protein